MPKRVAVCDLPHTCGQLSHTLGTLQSTSPEGEYGQRRLVHSTLVQCPANKWWLVLGLELVPDFPDGEDVPRAGGIDLELAP